VIDNPRVLQVNGVLLGSSAGPLSIGTSLNQGSLQSQSGDIVFTNNSTVNAITVNS